MELPPEDRRNTMDVGLIRGIVVMADDDPRLAEMRAAWSPATRTAQALHTADELLWGMRHHDWRVRYESVDRLIARAYHDGRTLPALLNAAVHDRSWEVRSKVVMRLTEFPQGAALPVLQAAAHDPRRDVRWSARFALFQKGFGSEPGPFDYREGGDGWCELADGVRALDED